MKKYECDLCKKIVNPKQIWGFEIMEIEEDGSEGSGVFWKEICSKCKNKITKLFAKEQQEAGK